MGEIRHPFSVKIPGGSMVEGFVKGMGADADGGPAQIEFAHIDGI